MFFIILCGCLFSQQEKSWPLGMFKVRTQFETKYSCQNFPYIPGTCPSTISATGKWIQQTNYGDWDIWTWRETSTGFPANSYYGWATSRLWKECACRNTVRTALCARWRPMMSLRRSIETTWTQQVVGSGMMKSNTARRWTSSNSGSGPRASWIAYAGLISMRSPTSHQHMTSP